jgi:spermidine synthase
MSLITALHPTPWSVYNIGLGGSVLPRFHLSRYPTSFVDSVEIDKVMIVVAKNYFRAEQANHTIIEGDGVEVLKRQKKVYQVVWIDAFIPEGVPEVFLSDEFLSILQIRSNPKNLVVFNLSTENLKKLRETVKRYKSRYSHGITVNLPEAKNQIILAVGSILTLTCSNFFSEYKNWVKQNLVTVRWFTKSINPITEICTDLH